MLPLQAAARSAQRAAALDERLVVGSVGLLAPAQAEPLQGMVPNGRRVAERDERPLDERLVVGSIGPQAPAQVAPLQGTVPNGRRVAEQDERPLEEHALPSVAARADLPAAVQGVRWLAAAFSVSQLMGARQILAWKAGPLLPVARQSS